LRVLNGGGDVSERRVESVGRRTLGQVDDLLGDVQGALEGQPSNPEARDLLADARSLREDIDERIRTGDLRRDDGGERRRNDGDRSTAGDRDRGREERDEPVTIDVTDSAGGDGSDRRGEETPDGPARRDEVDVDSELDSLRREVRGGDSDAAADDDGDDDGSAADDGDDNGDGDGDDR
jgi:hypothetical protein